MGYSQPTLADIESAARRGEAVPYPDDAPIDEPAVHAALAAHRAMTILTAFVNDSKGRSYAEWAAASERRARLARALHTIASAK